MPITQNIRRFQESITNELNITKNRVRDLIGNVHWGEDGNFKEAILRKVISQYIPSNLSIGTGFIVSNRDYINGSESQISFQLDIIVYDNRIPLIFKEGDFVIVTEDSVRAVIEVKTRTINYSQDNNNSLNKIIEKLNRLQIFPSFSPISPRRKFVRIFSYEHTGNFERIGRTISRNNRNREGVSQALINSNGLINHLALGPNFFIRYWSNTSHLVVPTHHEGRCYLKYELRNLSFSYFISNLLHISADRNPIQRSWFSFPIEGTKEINRTSPIIRLND